MKSFATFAGIILFLALCVSAQEKHKSSKSADLPVTVEIKQDVEVTHETVGGQVRGKLYLGGGTASKDFVMKKGQRFQMIALRQEGGCRIRFEGKEYELSSCPWLDGFRDHQADIFSVVTGK
jgi:hypothetical protein